MNSEVEVNEKKEILKTLNGIIDKFLEGKFNKFSISFEEYLNLTDEEYFDLIRNFDSSGGAVNNLGQYLIDTFSYDIDDYEKCVKILKKIFISYHYDENNNYVIHLIEGITEKRKVM